MKHEKYEVEIRQDGSSLGVVALEARGGADALSQVVHALHRLPDEHEDLAVTAYPAEAAPQWEDSISRWEPSVSLRRAEIRLLEHLPEEGDEGTEQVVDCLRSADVRVDAVVYLDGEVEVSRKADGTYSLEVFPK